MKGNVLLVEDIYINQLVVESFLVEAGFTVNVVNDGEEAIESLKHSTPDIIILDLMMPVMDGFSFLAEIKGHATFPILVVSARSDYESIEKAIELGASDYLIKPFNSKDLINKVERLCIKECL